MRTKSRTTRDFLPVFLFAAWLALGFSLPASPPPPKEQPHALVAVNVFTAEGLSLPGIPVSVRRKEDTKPKWRGETDRRGEWAVRVPPGRGTYEVATHSKEHENQTQTVEIYGQERVDIIFRLARKSGTEKKD